MPSTFIRNLDPTSKSGIARYAIGEANWSTPRIPDLINPTSPIVLTDNQRIDIIILGDGFSNQADFEKELSSWIHDFYDIEVYDKFCGAFRIHGLYTSSNPASSHRESYYQTAIIPEGKAGNGNISFEDWLEDSSTSNNILFRAQVINSVNRFSVNKKLYPSNLNNDSETYNELGNLYSNLVVVMLVRTLNSFSVSGRTGVITDHTLNSKPKLKICLGSYSIHELGHGFAYLEDEYITERGISSERSNPKYRSIFTLSNLNFSNHAQDVPWYHLSPFGKVPRHGAGDQPSPVVGWLWAGGDKEKKVWHSEYKCLMNGTHKNYKYSFDDALDVNMKGENLRFRKPPMFCLWCQEITVIRILEKTGQLESRADPHDINLTGILWYNVWVSQWRNAYWNFFNVTKQIHDRENLYKTLLSPTDLYKSELYTPFIAPPVSYIDASGLKDDEIFLMINS